nr:phosphodiester glycosidase family protein [Olivibacter sp. SDN3]
MVAYVDRDSSLLFGANADFFDADTGEPRGIVYLSGRPIRTTMPSGWTFFGVSKSGQLMIGDDVYFEEKEADIFHALGGHQILVKDGEPVTHTDASVEPRTAVGFTTDNMLYFVVVDGRKYDYSYGINFTDLGELMHALGATESINLDGGGSSTFLINNPMDTVYEVRNRPSDGEPRAVANGWAIVSSSVEAPI